MAALFIFQFAAGRRIWPFTESKPGKPLTQLNIVLTFCTAGGLLLSFNYIPDVLQMLPLPPINSLTPGEVLLITDMDETRPRVCPERCQMERSFITFVLWICRAQKPFFTLTLTVKLQTVIPGSQRSTGYVQQWEGFSSRDCSRVQRNVDKKS